jgi:acetylornithine deacetylase/succinyl-diaminopimelate desuccinylase-like protein
MTATARTCSSMAITTSSRSIRWNCGSAIRSIRCSRRAPTAKAIVGRGASDDKGQLRTFIEACRAWKETEGRLPVRVTILFEGEEESGSESLEPFLHANAEELKADFALICDTSMWDTATPGLTIGLRGMAGGQVTVRGPRATSIRASTAARRATRSRC